jgi:hypothetical protein
MKLSTSPRKHDPHNGNSSLIPAVYRLLRTLPGHSSFNKTVAVWRKISISPSPSSFSSLIHTPSFLLPHMVVIAIIPVTFFWWPHFLALSISFSMLYYQHRKPTTLSSARNYWTDTEYESHVVPFSICCCYFLNTICISSTKIVLLVVYVLFLLLAMPF